MGRRRIEHKSPGILVDLHLSNKELSLKYDVSQATIRNLRERVSSGKIDQLPLDEDPYAVIVLFRIRDGDLDESPVMDVLNSFMGIRVFHRDHIDPRVTMGSSTDLPHFEAYEDAVMYLYGDVGGFRPCTLSFVSAVSRISGPWADYRPEFNDA